MPAHHEVPQGNFRAGVERGFELFSAANFKKLTT
jgi:hypothetical protein